VVYLAPATLKKLIANSLLLCDQVTRRCFLNFCF